MDARPQPSRLKTKGQAAANSTVMSAARSLVTVNPTGLSDSPSAEDHVGFAPYVKALAWFLLSEKTLPPLTVSIEGPWGSGKSSFMLQLKNEIKQLSNADENHQNASAKNPKIYCVEFNAWRNDKEEELWAAFALTFIKQLSREIPIVRRIGSNIRLLWERVEWRIGRLKLFSLALFAIAVISITAIFILDPQQFLSTAKAPQSTILGLAWLAALWQGIKRAKDVLGNPLAGDIGKLTGNPKYEEKIAFIERFHEDFSKIVQSYVGDGSRVYVFIDDLDRCEVPTAANLMQAINLLLATEQTNLFFILGLDREMVAAGLAAKYEKILPYLAASRARSGKPDTTKVGIEYGYSFLEKFIQVPFRVPAVQEDQIGRWVSNLTGESQHLDASSPTANEIEFSLASGSDPEEFDQIVVKIARIFDFNPRRLKQFVNVFRLRVMIALSTNVLAPAYGAGRGTARQAGISLKQLGLFTALALKWPMFVAGLIDQPDMITRLCDPDFDEEADDPSMPDEKLMRALRMKEGYSLAHINLRPLLLVVPAIYAGSMRPSVASAARSQLVGVSDGIKTRTSSSKRPQKSRLVRK